MTEIISEFSQHISEFTALIYAVVIMEIFAWIFRICLMLAVGFDCKARGTKRKTMWMILTFFCPVIVGIIYICMRNNEPATAPKRCKNCGAVIDSRITFCSGCNGREFYICDVENRAKYDRNSKISLVASIISFAAVVVCAVVFYVGVFMSAVDISLDMLEDIVIGTPYSEKFDYDVHYGYKVDGRTVFYDRKGNVYTDDDDVLYYDRDGNTFKYDDDDFCFESTSDDKEYSDTYAYVDEEGYFYFDKKGYKDSSKAEINYSGQNDAYVDSKGNKYYSASEISWDKDGNMVDNYYGKPVD